MLKSRPKIFIRFVSFVLTNRFCLWFLLSIDCVAIYRRKGLSVCWGKPCVLLNSRLSKYFVFKNLSCLQNHTIPAQYGAVEPTAVFVPLKQILEKDHFEACTTEIFGPFQVVTTYSDDQLPLVLEGEQAKRKIKKKSVLKNKHSL